MKEILSNPYSKILAVCIAIALLLFLFPWNKIHFGDQKIVYTDSSKMKNKEVAKPVTKKIDTAASINKIAPLKSVLRVDKKTTPKIDTSKKQATTQAQFNLRDTTVISNYNEDVVFHPTDKLINKIIHAATSKNQQILIRYETSQAVKNKK